MTYIERARVRFEAAAARAVRELPPATLVVLAGFIDHSIASAAGDERGSWDALASANRFIEAADEESEIEAVLRGLEDRER